MLVANLKVALVYDRVNKFGGAERVLQGLHEIYPDAPLYTSVYNKETAPWADGFDVRTTFLQNIPYARTNHEYFAWFAPLAFESFDFSEYDLVVSITSEYAKGIITKPKTFHVCYCLTPTRYLWSGYEDYFQAPWFRAVTKPLVSYLRMWDKVASQRPDAYIAISKTVQGRINKYYERESEVIYPPVTSFVIARNSEAISSGIATSTSANSQDPRNDRTEKGYFLIVSRLVPYKRVDLAIEAFNKLGWSLKIIGSGREYQKLKNRAGPTIEFFQNLTDRALSRYYQDCTALIFPAEEDFGLAILEAQSFGKPVIAYRGGGAAEIIVEGKTGEFFFPQTAQAFIRVLQAFDSKRYNPRNAIRNAHKFSKERFKREFVQTIEDALENYKKNI